MVRVELASEGVPKDRQGYSYKDCENEPIVLTPHNGFPVLNYICVAFNDTRSLVHFIGVSLAGGSWLWNQDFW